MGDCKTLVRDIDGGKGRKVVMAINYLRILKNVNSILFLHSLEVSQQLNSFVQFSYTEFNELFVSSEENSRTFFNDHFRDIFL